MVSNKEKIRNIVGLLGIKRANKGKIFAGICKMLANKLSIGVWNVRLIAIILSLLSLGLGVIVYIFISIVLPKENKEDKEFIDKNKDYIDVNYREKN